MKKFLLYATLLALLAPALFAEPAAPFIALPQGQALGVLKDGAGYLEFAINGWGPKWSFLSFKGSAGKSQEAMVADNAAKIGDADVALKFKAGAKFSIQPALVDENGPVGVLSAPGYSYQYIGGDAQHIIIPEEVMRNNCLLPFDGEAFYLGSLAEPMSCIVGGYHANYHTTPGSYVHEMGIKEGGATAVLAGVGPMGLGAIDYAIHCDRKPALLVVTDIDNARLERAASIFTVEEAKKNGVKLIYVNTAEAGKGVDYLKSLTPNGGGFDDVFVYAPVRPVVEQADKILGFDGCLNFFAGPTDPEFSANFNFYNVHYAATHLVGTSGGNTDDMLESLKMMEAGLLNPSVMITHVGGLDAVIETTLNLPGIPGGKKLIYTGVSMPLVALNELSTMDGDFYPGLAEIVERNNTLWCPEAERFLLANAPDI